LFACVHGLFIFCAKVILKVDWTEGKIIKANISGIAPKQFSNVW